MMARMRVTLAVAGSFLALASLVYGEDAPSNCHMQTRYELDGTPIECRAEGFNGLVTKFQKKNLQVITRMPISIKVHNHPIWRGGKKFGTIGTAHSITVENGDIHHSIQKRKEGSIRINDFAALTTRQVYMGNQLNWDALKDRYPGQTITIYGRCPKTRHDDCNHMRPVIEPENQNQAGLMSMLGIGTPAADPRAIDPKRMEQLLRSDPYIRALCNGNAGVRIQRTWPSCPNTGGCTRTGAPVSIRVPVRSNCNGTVPSTGFSFGFPGQ
ncbi:MAG: hypothetical protein AB1696_26835 [Planctomycetota bacterium]